MSSTGTPASPAKSGLNWSAITSGVVSLINDGAPVVESLVPAWAPAIQIGLKLLTGAAQAEPVAVSLVQSIQSGQAPTPAQLQAFASDYEADYQALHADLAAQIAADPA